jgi:putative transposase
VNWFRTLFDAHKKITLWRYDYNTARPHSTLAYRTPDKFALCGRSSL